MLRSRYPRGVEQEVWALLTAYQVLRTTMADALLERPDIDPDRASFTTALRTARDQIVHAAGITAATTIDLVGSIGAAAIRADLMSARRTRTGTARSNARSRNTEPKAVTSTAEPIPRHSPPE